MFGRLLFVFYFRVGRLYLFMTQPLIILKKQKIQNVFNVIRLTSSSSGLSFELTAVDDIKRTRNRTFLKFISAPEYCNLIITQPPKKNDKNLFLKSE